MSSSSVAALRQFVRSRETGEKCDFCGESLSDDHIHQFDPAARRLYCTCERCIVLYGAQYRTVPRRVRALPDFLITDVQWEDLALPIGLAFFSYSTPAGRVVALYPGPAGATESSLQLDIWEEIIRTYPELAGLQPDVEALLVNRVGTVREYFLVPIDECYRLVGLIRQRWRGLSGGPAVWKEIANFMEMLRRKGEACPL